MIVDQSGHMDYGSLMKKALFQIREMRAKEAVRTDPVAVIGMSCRFPGTAKNIEAFWHLLRAGGDAISEVPAERWNMEEYYDSDRYRPGKNVYQVRWFYKRGG